MHKRGHTYASLPGLLFLSSKYLSVPAVSYTHTHSYHPDGPAGAHVVIMCIPTLELRVLSVLQNVLLALEVWVVEADKGPALHADRVDPVHEASILKVVAFAADLQFPPSEAFSFIEHDLFFATRLKYFSSSQINVKKVLQKLLFLSNTEPQISEKYLANMPFLRSEIGPVAHIIVFYDWLLWLKHLNKFRNAPLWLHSCCGTHLSWVLSHFSLLAVPN